MGRKEAAIEGYLCTQVGLQGGITRKVVYQGRKGSPDRWCIFPGGQILMVETKRPGETPEPLQIHEMEILRKLGCFVAWTDTTAGVDAILADFNACGVATFNERHPL